MGKGVYRPRLQDYKKELSDIHKDVLAIDLDDAEKCELQRYLNKDMFDCSLEIKKLLLPSAQPSDTTTVPSEAQFSVSINSRSHLSDSEKLVYLRHSLKDGSAKGVIEGLLRLGE